MQADGGEVGAHRGVEQRLRSVGVDPVELPEDLQADQAVQRGPCGQDVGGQPDRDVALHERGDERRQRQQGEPEDRQDGQRAAGAAPAVVRVTVVPRRSGDPFTVLIASGTKPGAPGMVQISGGIRHPTAIQR